MWTNIAVTIADIAIFTKLFPINIAAINLSNFVIMRWISWARFTPWLIILRSRILLKAIMDVSDKEKKKDKAAKKNKLIAIMGIEDKESILRY